VQQSKPGTWWSIRVASLRGLIVALIAVVVVAAAVVAKIVVPGTVPSSVIEASGTIEATESDISPKVGGRLVDLRVRDGDRVRKGQVVAVLERLDPALKVDQARGNVAVALAQVGVARAAYSLQRDTYRTTLTQASSGVAIARSRVGQAGENLRIETRDAGLHIDQARAQLRAARSAYVRAEVNLRRARSLVATGDEARQSLDDATNAYAGTTAQLRTAQDALALAQADQRTVQVRELDVRASRLQQQQSVATLASAQAERELVTERRAQLAAAEGALTQSRAALGLAQDEVRETDLAAPFDGYVISHNFEVGDLLQPGSAAMTVGDLVHTYVDVYVSETGLPHVKTGMHADVTIDGMPGRTYVGTVTEISNTAEFTPANVQTKEQRIEYLVFRVRIQFNDTTASLKPGLPVDAVIHV
jgi:HlyD family secretion protein